MNNSLRIRLLVGVTLATTVILTLFGVGLFLSMRQILLADFDSALLAKAYALASMAEQDGHEVKFESDYLEMHEFTTSPTPEYFEVHQSDGRLIANSPSLQNRTLGQNFNPAVAMYRSVTLPDGRDGRIVTLPFKPRFEIEENSHGREALGASQSAVLVLGSDLNSLNSVLRRLGILLLGSCGLAIVVSGATLFLIVGRAMRPVARLAMQIELLTETGLSARLHAADAPSELKPVVQHLNGLLVRLEHAFARERAFAADVAHELRTPLSGLQTTLQVCRTRPRVQAEYETMIDKCLKIGESMRTTVETLLFLARAEAGQLQFDYQRFDITHLMAECWSSFQLAASERGLHAQFMGAEKCFVDSDPGKLKIVFDNLFENAIAYADLNKQIRINTTRLGQEICIAISNPAKDLQRADVERLFDRFTRGDAARSETGIHCGLGLSICRRIVILLGGQIGADASAGDFMISILFPSNFEPKTQHVSGAWRKGAAIR